MQPRNFSPACLRRPFYAAPFPKKAHVPSWNSKGSLTRFTKLQKFPEIPVPTREERSISRHKSRRDPFSPPQVEMTVDCPASPGKECQRPGHTSRGGCYLTETGGETGGLSEFEIQLFPHPLDIRPDSLALIQKSARIISQTEGSSDAPVANSKGATGPKFNSPGGLKPL